MLRQFMLSYIILLCLALTQIHALAAGPLPSVKCPVKRIQVERLPDLNVAREGHTVLCLNGELTVLGGHTTGFIPTSTAEFFRNGKWKQLQMFYMHDEGTVLAMKSGQVLLAGGLKDNLGIGQSFEVELYNPEDHSFGGFGCLDQKRSLASAIELDSGQVLISGNWYADDCIEMYDGRKSFAAVRDVTVPRAAPYLFRTSNGDVLVLSGVTNKHQYMDSIIVDRLHGDAFMVPIFQHWRPAAPFPCHPETGFIGDESRGHYAYLMTVRDFARHDLEAERHGKPAGQVAVVLVEDTVFSLLPTSCPIPMYTPEYGPIYYDISGIVVDRKVQRAYLMGADKDNRLYVVSIGYARRPASLTLYYTDPLPDCGCFQPTLMPDGNLAVIGGSLRPGFSGDSYAPVASAYLLLLNRPADAKGSSMFSWWLLILGGMVALVVGAGIRWLARRRKRGMPSPAQDEIKEPAPMNDADEVMMARINQLMEEEKLYLDKGLLVTDIAQRLGVHRNTVSSCINNQCGCSFNTYINGYRIEYAMQQFRQHPDGKIVAVGLESGFSTERSFYRAFKAVTGLTPSEWIAQSVH